jgi:hypothetical protein
MNVINFDALARRAVTIEDRRSALKSLAAAALVTGIAASQPAAAKKRSKKKSQKNKALQKCKAQVAPCQAALETQCDPGEPGFDDCQANVAECCAFLGGCNAQAAMDCVISLFVV